VFLFVCQKTACQPRLYYAVLATDQEVISNTKMIHAHAQDFVTNDELLLHLKALDSSPVHYMLLVMFDVFCLCAVEDLSVTPTNSSQVDSAIDSSPLHLTRHAHLHEDSLWLVRLAVEMVEAPNSAV
jgi:hypothetical protein